MANTRAKPRNTSDSITLSTISLNSSTKTKLVDANVNRLSFTASNNSNKDIWLIRQAAAGSATEDIIMPAKSFYEMPTDPIYTGEISAIALNGTPDITVGES